MIKTKPNSSKTPFNEGESTIKKIGEIDLNDIKDDEDYDCFLFIDTEGRMETFYNKEEFLQRIMLEQAGKDGGKPN